MILTPGFTRSSHPWMFLGLPLGTTSTTTDWVRMPLVGVSFQVSETCLLSTRRCTSGSNEKCTTSALRPPSTARLWSPEAPYDVSKPTSLPSEVLFQSAMTCLLACSRIEKPTRLRVSEPDPLAPDEVPPQPARATTPATDAATAAFHFMLICDSFLFRWPSQGSTAFLSPVDYSPLLDYTCCFALWDGRRVATHKD